MSDKASDPGPIMMFRPEANGSFTLLKPVFNDPVFLAWFGLTVENMENLAKLHDYVLQFGLTTAMLIHQQTKTPVYINEFQPSAFTMAALGVDAGGIPFLGVGVKLDPIVTELLTYHTFVKH